MFDPVHLGVDEYGEHVYVNLAERNMLIGGEPGGGKSSAENLIVAHGALSHDCRLVLVDGNQVQLGPWRHSADMFIGPSLKDATQAFTELYQQTSMNRTAGHRPPQDHPRRRRARLPGRHRRVRLLLGHHRQEATGDFAALARDLIARGRAAGVILILATQRPSHQIIDPSIGTCRRPWASADRRHPHPRLGQGWPAGYTAADMDPLARGTCSPTGSRSADTTELTDSSDVVLGQGWARQELHRRAAHDLAQPSRHGQTSGRVEPKGAGRVCGER